MNKVAIYCRISVEDKGFSESESIKNQKNLLEKFAKDRGYSIYKIYCDEDFSGLDNERPAFKQLIADAENKLFDTIICKNQSRFTRDMRTAEEYIGIRFPELNIRFIGVVDNVDTAKKSTKRVSQINSLINEWYCEEISENIRSVFKRKMETGLFIGTYAPYGYVKSCECKHKLLVDYETCQNVKLIFDMFLEGKSCGEIAKILTFKNIKTPSQYKSSKGIDRGRKVKKEGVWSPNTVRKILKNPVYIGHMVQGKERKVSYKSSKVRATPKDEWIWVFNTHKPIVSEDIFYKVQKRFER